VSPLGRIEFENAREIVEKAGGDADVSPLFKPCVPAKSDAGEGGHLLASQAGRAPSSAGGQADIRRCQAFALRAQEICQFRPGSFERTHLCRH